MQIPTTFNVHINSFGLNLPIQNKSMQFLKTLKRLYFWITSKFKSKMSIQEVYSILNKDLVLAFESIKKHTTELANAETNAYLKIINQEDNKIEFRIGTYKFVLVGEIIASTGILHFTTYQIVVNKESYPNKKLEPIDSLDILHKLLIPTSSFTTFLERKEIVGMNNTMITGLAYFGQRYITELLSFIQNRESNLSHSLMNKIPKQ